MVLTPLSNEKHRCGCETGWFPSQPSESEATMKTVTIPDWFVPLLVGIAVVGVIVSLVVAALFTA